MTYTFHVAVPLIKPPAKYCVQKQASFTARPTCRKLKGSDTFISSYVTGSNSAEGSYGPRERAVTPSRELGFMDKRTCGKLIVLVTVVTSCVTGSNLVVGVLSGCAFARVHKPAFFFR